jgi:hypothetical protein
MVSYKTLENMMYVFVFLLFIQSISMIVSSALYKDFHNDLDKYESNNLKETDEKYTKKHKFEYRSQIAILVMSFIFLIFVLFIIWHNRNRESNDRIKFNGDILIVVSISIIFSFGLALPANIYGLYAYENKKEFIDNNKKGLNIFNLISLIYTGIITIYGLIFIYLISKNI